VKPAPAVNEPQATFEFVTMRLFASMRPSMSERNPIPLILTAIGSVVGTVAVLTYYGYVHIAKPEDALLLADYTMLKTVPGEDYRVSLKPASQVAQCIDGVLVLFDTEQKGLTGVLVDNKKRAVRCMEEQVPAGLLR
jgi:hypothetical protein